jgi:hypothetical protein
MEDNSFYLHYRLGRSSNDLPKIDEKLQLLESSPRIKLLEMDD